MYGIRTRGLRLEGTDEATELWRPTVQMDSIFHFLYENDENYVLFG